MTPSQGERRSLRFALIGQGLLLSMVCTTIAGRGHEIATVFATNAEGLDLPGLDSDRIAGVPLEPEAWLLGRPCDVLLSVNNRFVMPPAMIRRPKILAVNYHDSLLPAYAGLRATAWAIYHGERAHGITWHRISERIDQGDILVTRRFQLDPGETTESLNRRCTEAAIQSFPELLAKLETGNFAPVPLPDVIPSHFGCRDRLPDGGIIDWSMTAEQIERAVRSTTWGPVKNDFGSVRLRLAEDRIVSVLAAQLGEKIAGVPSGTVVDVFSRKVAVAATGRRLDLTVSEALPVSLLPGSRLGHLDAPDTGICAMQCVSGEIPWVVKEIVRWGHQDVKSTAIRGPQGDLDYSELNARSDRLATGLRARGVGPGTVVGVSLGSDADVVVSLVGVLKAGAAFLVLEETAIDRLRVMIAAAAPVGVVIDGTTAHRYKDCTVPSWRFDDLAETPSRRVSATRLMPDSPAYVVFTSGSSGAPKGVWVGHHSLAYFLRASRELFPVRTTDRVFQLCSLGFDAAIEEIFSALTAGAMLCLRPRTGTLTMARLLAHHEREGITISGVFGSRLADLIRAMEQRDDFPQSVRRVTTGGEEVSPGLVSRWKTWFKSHDLSPPELINVYGLTETTIGSLYQDLNQIPHDAGRLHFDRSLPGTLFSIRDEKGRKVKPGGEGELWIGGPGIAQGYLDSGADTDSGRFVEDGDDRWYRTGDRFRQTDSGHWDFLGRFDRQLKILGHRIEPQEVENACLSVLPVLDCTVVPLHKRDTTFLACIVLDEEAAQFELLSHKTVAAFRQQLATKLPPAMSPTLFYRIPAWPRSSTGKLDQCALEKLVAHNDSQSTTLSEGALPRLVTEHLRIDLAGREGVSLFDLGADSIGLIQLFSAIDTRLGAAISIERFLQNPTLDHLAALVDMETRGGGTPERSFIPRNDRQTAVPITNLTRSVHEPPLIWIGGKTSFLEELTAFRRRHVSVKCFQVHLDMVQMRSADVNMLAVRFADSLLSSGQNGPYRIGGISFNALVAHALAVELKDRGEEVAFVFLVSPAKILGESRIGWPLSLRAFAPEGGSWSARMIAGKLLRTPQRLKARYRARNEIREFQRKGVPKGVNPWPHLWPLLIDALRRYRPKPFKGAITVVYESDQRPAIWADLARETRFVQIGPCEHSEVMNPPHLRDWLSALDGLLLGNPKWP